MVVLTGGGGAGSLSTVHYPHWTLQCEDQQPTLTTRAHVDMVPQ